MKSRLMLVLLGLLFATSVASGAGESNRGYVTFRAIASTGSPQEIRQAVRSADDLFPGRVRLYSQCLEDLIAVLSTRSERSPDIGPLFEEVIFSVLDKPELKWTPALDPDGAGLFLRLRFDAFQALMGQEVFRNWSGKERMRIAAKAESFLLRMDRERVRDYKWKPVSANVAPATTFPVTRDAYAKAIETNSRNNFENGRQSFLKTFVPMMKLLLARFVRETAQKDPAVQAEAERMLQDLNTAIELHPGPE